MCPARSKGCQDAHSAITHIPIKRRTKPAIKPNAVEFANDTYDGSMRPGAFEAGFVETASSSDGDDGIWEALFGQGKDTRSFGGSDE